MVRVRVKGLAHLEPLTLELNERNELCSELASAAGRGVVRDSRPPQGRPGRELRRDCMR